MMRRCLALPAVLLLGVLLAGCATMRIADQLDRTLVSGDYAGGLAEIEKAQTQYAGPNSLLYYFDKGSLAQRAGDYVSSNQALEQAELLIEQLYTKSVGESAASFLVNDMTLSYSGEDFEQVMVHIMKALNFLYLGDFGGAQVEARKVNNRLLALSDKYGNDAVYKEDAFARYLSAFAYEAVGEYNDAYIDYKKAYQGFKWYQKHFETEIPPFIGADLLRLSRWMGYDDEYAKWQERFGKDVPAPSRRPAKQSEVMLVVYDGLMLPKITRYVEVGIMDPDHNPYILKVAFPAFKMRRPALEAIGLTLPDRNDAWAYVMEPLASIAVQNLEQRIALISVKAIARATAKYIAAYQVRKATKSGNEGANMLVGLATNIYTWATEHADTRSWRTLPNRFLVFRVPLPAGKHELQLTLQTKNGAPRTKAISVELKSGEKKVMPVYVVK